MLVSEVMALCDANVLKQISVNETDLLSYVNLALLEVHKKFDIIIHEQIIAVDPTINEYRLNDDVMIITAAFTAEKYLKNTDGSIAFITGDTPVSIPLNDEGDVNSVFTPSTRALLVPYPSEGQLISLLYKASPVVITEDDLDQELEVAPQYIKPLMMYIGFLGYLSVDAGIQTDNDNYQLKYEMACAEIKDLGLTNTNIVVNNKLEQKGFA